MLSVVMLSVVMLSVGMLSVVMLSVVMLSVVMLSGVMLSVVVLSVVILGVVMLGVITLNVTYKPFVLSVVRLNVIRLSVVAPNLHPYRKSTFDRILKMCDRANLLQNFFGCNFEISWSVWEIQHRNHCLSKSLRECSQWDKQGKLTSQILD